MRVLLPMLPAVLAACAAATTPWSGAALRMAEDTPPAFAPEDGVMPTTGCRNPLVDPRDQTRLRLVRSAAVGSGERGDYEVPAGRYGVGPGELLRIECSTGQPLGIVRT